MFTIRRIDWKFWLNTTATTFMLVFPLLVAGGIVGPTPTKIYISFACLTQWWMIVADTAYTAAAYIYGWRRRTLWPWARHLMFDTKSGQSDIAKNAILNCSVAFISTILTFAITYGLISQLDPTAFSVHLKGLFEAIYYSVVTIATVGYGDIAPRSFLARGFTVLEILTGLLFATFYFSLLSAFARERASGGPLDESGQRITERQRRELEVERIVNRYEHRRNFKERLYLQRLLMDPSIFKAYNDLESGRGERPTARLRKQMEKRLGRIGRSNSSLCRICDLIQFAQLIMDGRRANTLARAVLAPADDKQLSATLAQILDRCGGDENFDAKLAYGEVTSTFGAQKTEVESAVDVVQELLRAKLTMGGFLLLKLGIWSLGEHQESLEEFLDYLYAEDRNDHHRFSSRVAEFYRNSPIVKTIDIPGSSPVHDTKAIADLLEKGLSLPNNEDRCEFFREVGLL